MKIRKFYSLANDVYTVAMHTEDWSQEDQNLIVEFGEPQIDLGGIFGQAPGLVFVLPANLANIMTGSPFTQSFDARDYDDADDRANLWATTVSHRIVVAVTLLRSNMDAFSKEVVETV